MSRTARFGFARLVVLAVFAASGALAGPPPAATGPGTASVAWTSRTELWIWSKPTTASQRMGYLRGGVPFALAGTETQRGAGCRNGFLALVPRGFVCSDHVTLGKPAPDERAAMLAPTATALPFAYAISNGAPMYTRLPTEREWTEAERWLGAPGTFPRYRWNEKHERLARPGPISANGPVPLHLIAASSTGSRSDKPPSGKPRSGKVVQRTVQLGSLVAYTRAFAHAGRTWLLTSEGLVVPADRVRPYETSAYRGVELGQSVNVPLALFRAEVPTYVLRGEALVPSGFTVPARGFRELDAAVPAREVKGMRYLATKRRTGAGQGGKSGAAQQGSVDTNGGAPVSCLRDTTPNEKGCPGSIVTRKAENSGASPRSGPPSFGASHGAGTLEWISEKDASVVRARDSLPSVVGENEPWIHVSIEERVLVAYVGKEPVFATLVAPGAGGLERKGQDAVKASTTPLGTYRIQYKHSSQTMSPDKGKPRDEWQHVFAEVPRAQYFEVPFALHTAYWHESFGEFMSGGCVNLSPLDGEWLFQWTTPRLPAGWGGVWAGGENGVGTRLLITR